MSRRRPPAALTLLQQVLPVPLLRAAAATRPLSPPSCPSSHSPLGEPPPLAHGARELPGKRGRDGEERGEEERHVDLRGGGIIGGGGREIRWCSVVMGVGDGWLAQPLQQPPLSSHPSPCQPSPTATGHPPPACACRGRTAGPGWQGGRTRPRQQRGPRAHGGLLRHSRLGQ